jgi:hypothetical protein
VDLLRLVRTVALEVAIDAHPVHLAAHQHLSFADDWDAGWNRDNTRRYSNIGRYMVVNKKR